MSADSAAHNMCSCTKATKLINIYDSAKLFIRNRENKQIVFAIGGDVTYNLY